MLAQSILSACFAILVAVVLMVVNEWTKRLIFEPADRLRSVVERVLIWISSDGYVLANLPADEVSKERLAQVLESLNKIYSDLRCANRGLVSWNWVRWAMRTPSYSDVSFTCTALLILINHAPSRFDSSSQFSFNDVNSKIQNRLHGIDKDNDKHQEALRFRPPGK